ncbi:MAG: alpha/beta hydrolase, partial [Oscillospiraceae bacterium]
LPSAEFGPLMRRLGEEYKVVCVEYFGVGFSSETERPRTCENYVEEIRTALSKSGFKAPYVLMPHSISSVFSEYYAEKYPDEVEAIISLDGTSTAIEGEMPAFVKYVLPIAKFQQAIGTTSLLGPLATNRKKLAAYGYTEKEINDMITFSGFSMNDNALQEILGTVEYIKQTKELPFPENVPYFKIISRQTYETSNSQLRKLGITPQEYQQKHLERIGDKAKFEILDGTHFIYLNNVGRIADIADYFLPDY